MEPIRVFFLHRHQLLIGALANVLRRRRLATVVGHSGDLREALLRLSELVVDVLLVEAELVRENSNLMIRKSKAVSPGLKVLPFDLEDDEEILRLLAAGASGYVRADASLEEMIESLLAVHQGRPLCSGRLVASVASRIAALSRRLAPCAPSCRPSSVRLTPREQDVLLLLVEGRQNKAIAELLTISISTVKIYVHKILGKLRVRNRWEAAKTARESGLASELSEIGSLRARELQPRVRKASPDPYAG